MVFKASLTMLAKGLTACVLSVGLLWQIAERSGPQTNEVVVHVSRFPAVVTIDGEPYRVLSWQNSPVVRELRAGWHDLKIWRGGAVTHQERFHVDVGENIVLSDPAPPASNAASPVPGVVSRKPIP